MPAISTSNSYVTYAELQTYCDLAGKSTPAQSVAEPRLIQATLAVDRKWGGRFIGRKMQANQPLAWPRSPSTRRNIDTPDGFYSVDQDGNYRDLNQTPKEVKDAVCEMALALLSGKDLYSAPAPAITEATDSIDVLQSTYKYAGQHEEISSFDYLIDVILRPILLPTQTTVKFTI